MICGEWRPMHDQCQTTTGDVLYYEQAVEVACIEWLVTQQNDSWVYHYKGGNQARNVREPPLDSPAFSASTKFPFRVSYKMRFCIVHQLSYNIAFVTTDDSLIQ